MTPTTYPTGKASPERYQNGFKVARLSAAFSSTSSRLQSAAMADEIERLVLSPFREIVEKANLAVDNADAAEDDEPSAAPMRKAAQALAKEGERALKKIEPLCNKNYDEYASSFVDAMKEHGECPLEVTLLC